MTDILSYLLAGAYSGISALYGAAAATCIVNGELLNRCSPFFGFFDGIFYVTIAISILMIVSMWIVFKKAGRPGWAAIIPIYNTIVMLQIAKKPIWWIILYFIPFVNIIISIIVIYNIALAFDKGGGFALGLILLPFIFYPILAFGKSTYMQGAQAVSPAGTPPSAIS